MHSATVKLIFYLRNYQICLVAQAARLRSDSNLFYLGYPKL